jgi:hypothetical protein
VFHNNMRSNVITSSPSWIFAEKNLVMDEMIADERRKHSTPSIIVLHLRGGSLMLRLLEACDVRYRFPPNHYRNPL